MLRGMGFQGRGQKHDQVLQGKGCQGGVMHTAYHTEKLSFLFLISI